MSSSGAGINDRAHPWACTFGLFLHVLKRRFGIALPDRAKQAEQADAGLDSLAGSFWWTAGECATGGLEGMHKKGCSGQTRLVLRLLAHHEPEVLKSMLSVQV